MARIAGFFMVAGAALALGCGGGEEGGGEGRGSGGAVKTITIDGSSTVFPITAAVAEDFQKANRDLRIAVSYSGTGGGFKKFIAGETDINNASRPISASEAQALAAKGEGFIELPVAYDGLTVIVNPKNDWVDFLTVEELNRLWAPGSAISKWSEVRAGWPDAAIGLYGAGTDSGTFDYFTEAIMGKSGASRPDYTATEDDNLTVQGVAGDVNGLGYLGIAYYEENKSIVRAVPIKDGDKAPVFPSIESVMNSTYTPLSRPLFIYVREASAKRPEVRAFIKFLVEEGQEIVGETGYVRLPERAYEMAWARFEAGTTGSVFDNHGATVGVSVEDLLSREATPANKPVE